MTLSQIKKKIRSIPDFPKKGIIFRDITPLLMDGSKFGRCIDLFIKACPKKVDTVISIESRGFILGSAMAYALGSGFVPIRKSGKLPHKTFQMPCELEYGQTVLELHTDSLKKGGSAIIVDDVLATGGTAQAALNLARKTGVHIAGLFFLIELKKLGGREKLSGYPVYSLIHY